jgi:hypothetical protein
VHYRSHDAAAQRQRLQRWLTHGMSHIARGEMMRFGNFFYPMNFDGAHPLLL